jgi:hypothetical protein
LEGHLTEWQRRRLLSSIPRHRKRFGGHPLEEAEARHLGLTWTQYRLWRRAGVDAIAEADVSSAALDGAADGAALGGFGLGREVRQCEKSEHAPQVAMFA